MVSFLMKPNKNKQFLNCTHLAFSSNLFYSKNQIHPYFYYIGTYVAATLPVPLVFTEL